MLAVAVLWAAAASHSCAVGGGDGDEPGCLVGSEGCDCTPGGACDPGLACFSGLCVDPGPSGGGGDQGSGPGPGAGGAPQTSSPMSSASNAASSSNTASSTASSSSGGSCPLANPSGVTGCGPCAGACDAPWPASWSAVSGATHYLVEYTCLLGPTAYQTSTTSVDLCSQVGMCNDNACANGVASVVVRACDATCCSSGTPVPDAPLACGGGVCC